MCAQVLLPANGADTAGLAERLDRLERMLSASGQAATAPAPGTAAPRASVPATSPSGTRASGMPAPGTSAPGTSAPATESSSPRTASSRPAGTSAPRFAQQPAQQPTPPVGPGPQVQAASTPALAPATADEPSTASPATPSPGAGTGEVPADTQALRARWPDVLAAVQSHGKRVAWIQLSNASVESFAEGVLTLAFAQAGMAKGFETGGYDKDLSQVLSDMFGVTPVIRTSVGMAGSVDSGPGPTTYLPQKPAERSTAPRPADDEPDAARPGPTARAADPSGGGTGRPQQQPSARGVSARPDSSRADSSRAASGRNVSAGTVSSSTVSSSTVSSSTVSSSAGSSRAASSRAASARAASSSAASARNISAGTVSTPSDDDNEPAPGDRPAPDVLTGTDLIERELGGRIIQELDSP
jgi:DNA polymerase-3 subunit gamma/tau